MTFSVGLTGGIGSGKSSVARLFQKLGATIIDADQMAHQITQPNTYAFEDIIQHFGRSFMQSDGTLNRSKLRRSIFDDPDKRRWLEARLHPVIREAMKSQLSRVDSVYAVLVIPLLAESFSKHWHDLNRICVIQAPKDQQIKRVMARDHMAESAVRTILNTQCSDEARIKIADDIIKNDSDFEKLPDQVARLNQLYLKLADNKKKGCE